MSDFVHSLGDSVKRARQAKGLTQAQVAEKIGVDQRTIINIENYRGNPKLEVLFPLVRLLEIDPFEIFYPELEQTKESAHRIQIMLKDADKKEIEFLFSICRAVMDVMRSDEEQTVKVE